MGTYKGRYFARETTYSCGDYMDGAIYPVFQAPGKRRKKCKPTAAIQHRLNQRNAERKLVRLVHSNFTANDLALHLTYRPGETPKDDDAAAKELRNFLRRAKRLYAAKGMEMKYISCTETGTKNGRIHHHLIISGGVDRDALERVWGRGYANTKRLQFDDSGVTGLTHYMAKDHKMYRRWNSSRNLIRPEPIQRDGDISVTEMQKIAEAIDALRAAAYFEARYPGYELTEATWERNGVNRGTYIRFAMKRKGEHT